VTFTCVTFSFANPIEFLAGQIFVVGPPLFGGDVAVRRRVHDVGEHALGAIEMIQRFRGDIVAGAADHSPNTEVVCKAAEQPLIDDSQQGFGSELAIERLQPIQDLREERSLTIGMTKGGEMLDRPPRIGDARFLDALARRETTGASHWHGEPDKARLGLDLIAVAPVLVRILDAVGYEELVAFPYEVEVPAPGNVVGLVDADRLGHCPPELERP